MPHRWHELPVSREGPLPLLLYKFISTSHGYQFYLTDLTHIWSEHLKYDQILQKAEETETSIDPSEDADQFGVFLQKIRDALEGVKHSSVDLAPGKSDSVEITTTTELPGGLSSLQWTFVLSKGRPSAVTRHLLVPLLRSEQEHSRRERELLESIAEKDRVLSKIFDKIDTTQLTNIFPGTAGPRNAKLRTSDLLKHIKGASRFNESEWRKSFPVEASDTIVAGDITDLASGVLEPSQDEDTPLENEEWWHTLDKKKQVDRSKSAKTKSPIQREPTASKKAKEKEEDLGLDDSTDDEGEFQRQETPPHLKRDKRNVNNQPDVDKYGTSDSEVDEALSAHKPKSTKTGPQQAERKAKVLGKIGGPKAIPEKSQRLPSSIESTASSDELEPTHANEETESDSLSPQRRSAVSRSSPQDKAPVPPKRKGGLGKIGGKKREPTKDEPRQQPASPPPENSGSTQPTKKLGTIGSKKTAPTTSLPSRETSGARRDMTASDDDSDDLDSAPRPSQSKPVRNESPPPSEPTSPVPKRQPPSEPEPELTAEQKANKKREELKRQMEAQSKAPQKKKRKF